jgi:hypothetical protein
MARNVTLVNNFYPISYFADQDITNVAPNAPEQFWASIARPAPATEELVFDFGLTRPCNFVDFEISSKPIDIQIFYEAGGEWIEVEPDNEFQTSNSVHYISSADSSWIYFEFHMKLVTTQFFRIVFTRRTDPFPFLDSKPIDFSVEIRNLRLMHIISRFDEFIVDNGVDILGNSYRTEAALYDAANVADNDPTTFWQSQPNPTQFAVEALYFDVRLGDVPGSMLTLDQADMTTLDVRSMSDMTLYHNDGIIVDEIFIDPVTTGPIMHVYYSLDDTPEWDNKLWTPIPRHYILKRGFFQLPRPTMMKYVKLEFTRLVPMPYNTTDYPILPQITYKRYPTWVQNYFTNTYIKKPITDTFLNPIDTVKIDPLALGFVKPIDNLESGSETKARPSIIETSNSEIKDFIEELISTQKQTDTQIDIESVIEFNSSFMWQRDLMAQLDTSRALSRVAQIDNTGFNSELPPLNTPPPTSQSVSDLSQAKLEKEVPIMWFPITCRHGYQETKGDYPGKLAFIVAIRSVEFYRSNNVTPVDEEFYVDTLSDTNNINTNDFEFDEWRLIVK